MHHYYLKIIIGYLDSLIPDHYKINELFVISLRKLHIEKKKNSIHEKVLIMSSFCNIMSDFTPPNFWDFLNDNDKHIYKKIYNALRSPKNNDKRFKRIDDFNEIINAIDLFENINDNDKWKRCLVCGIFKVKDMIAVNIHQLQCLIAKCKSSINGSLRKIGYGNIVKKEEGSEFLFEIIPYLKSNPSERRKWTLRFYNIGEKYQVQKTEENEKYDETKISDLYSFSLDEWNGIEQIHASNISIVNQENYESIVIDDLFQ